MKLEEYAIQQINFAFTELRETVERQDAKIIEQEKQIAELSGKIAKYESKTISTVGTVFYSNTGTEAIIPLNNDATLSKLANEVEKAIKRKQNILG
jgi:uncharacterized coiled-coil protein SlyX